MLFLVEPDLREIDIEEAPGLVRLNIKIRRLDCLAIRRGLCAVPLVAPFVPLETLYTVNAVYIPLDRAISDSIACLLTFSSQSRSAVRRGLWCVRISVS